MLCILVWCQVAREHEVLVSTEGAGEGELTGQVVYPSQQLEKLDSVRRGTALMALVILPKVSAIVLPDHGYTHPLERGRGHSTHSLERQSHSGLAGPIRRAAAPLLQPGPRLAPPGPGDRGPAERPYPRGGLSLRPVQARPAIPADCGGSALSVRSAAAGCYRDSQELQQPLGNPRADRGLQGLPPGGRGAHSRVPSSPAGVRRESPDPAVAPGPPPVPAADLPHGALAGGRGCRPRQTQLPLPTGHRVYYF